MSAASTTKQSPTIDDYHRVFLTELVTFYQVIDSVEHVAGFRADAGKLEAAARVLACPVKKNRPNWQHGRVLYAVLRRYLADVHLQAGSQISIVDIGTAKGFSALCMAWALADSGWPGEIVSVDVIDPAERVRRNTVAEVDGLRTLYETVEPWREDLKRVRFLRSTGVDYLRKVRSRIHFAFVDGKHSGHEVIKESRLISSFQATGDVCIWDDVHLADVNQAVGAMEGDYKLRRVDLQTLGVDRAYAIGFRR